MTSAGEDREPVASARRPARIVGRLARLSRRVAGRLLRSPRAARLAWLRITRRDLNMHLGSCRSDVPIDIVIAAAERDLTTLALAARGAQRNVAHPIRRIYVVAPATSRMMSLCREEGWEFVDENAVLPIRAKDITYTVAGIDRAGWLFAQLLKLSATDIGTTDHCLVVDADTVFIRPQVFRDGSRTILNWSDEYHRPYYLAYARLLGSRPSLRVSFVSHHMLIERRKIAALRAEIEARHRRAWHEAILAVVDHADFSGFSEYELYGHFVHDRFPHEIALTYWYNKAMSRRNLAPVNELERAYAHRYKSLSFHHYLE
jgi:Family of unknown function (DUF6492)